MKSQSEVLVQIEVLREKMVYAALLLGFDHPIVLEYSQKLDKKHNLIIASHS